MLWSYPPASRCKPIGAEAAAVAYIPPKRPCDVSREVCSANFERITPDLYRSRATRRKHLLASRPESGSPSRCGDLGSQRQFIVGNPQAGLIFPNTSNETQRLNRKSLQLSASEVLPIISVLEYAPANRTRERQSYRSYWSRRRTQYGPRPPSSRPFGTRSR